MVGLAESLEDSAGAGGETHSFPMRKSVLCPNRALLCSDGAEFLDSVDTSSREKDGDRPGDEMDIDSTVNVGDEIVIQWATDGPLSNEFYECVVMGRRKDAGKDTFVVMHCDRWAEETVNLLPSSRGRSWMLSADAHDLPIYLAHCSSTVPMQKRCILRLHPSGPSEPALVRGVVTNEPSTWDELAGVPFTGDEGVPALVKARESIVARIAEQRLPGVSDLAAPVHLGEIYQAACPLVFPVKEYAADKGNVDVGVIDLERIKVLGAFVGKNEKIQGLKRPSTPMAINGQGKRVGGVEKVMAELKRKTEIFVEKCSEKMPHGWAKMESVGAETVAKRARIDRVVEEAQASLDTARGEAEYAEAIEKAANEAVMCFVAEQTSMSTDNEQKLLSKLGRLQSAINDESRESLWYHEKFFACGDLHPSTPNGAAHALISMKKTEVRRSCFALAAIRLVATSATSTSGNYPRAIRIPGALSPEGGKRSMDILLKIAASKNKASPSKDFPSKEADPNQPLVAIMPEQVGSDQHIGSFNWARRQTLVRIKEDTALQSRVSTLPVTTYPPVVLHPLAELIVGAKFGDGMLELARAVCGSMELVLDDKACCSICVLDSAKPGDFEAACIEGCLYSALAYNSVDTLAMVVVGDDDPNPLFEAAVAGSGGMLTLTHIRPGANDEAEKYQEIRAGKPNFIMVIADANLPGEGPSRQGGGVGKVALEGVVRTLSALAKELKGRLNVSIDGGARGCLYVPGIASAMLGTDPPQQEGAVQQAQQWERNVWSMIPLEDLGFTYSNSCRFAPVLGSVLATPASAVSYVAPKAAGSSEDAIQEGCNIVELLSRGLPFRLMACSASSDSATFGVLAQEPIPKGSVVCEFVGEVAKQCGGQGGEESAEGGAKSTETTAGEKRPTYELRTLAYGKSIRWSIDATRFGNVSRLISRGDEGDANLAPVEFADPRALPSPDSPPNLNRIALVAIRDIDQDEELVWA